MISQLHHRVWHYGLLLSLSTLMYFANLGEASLWDVDEGRNITAAFEMMESGNWIVPTFNAKLRVDKPVLLYWLQVLSFYSFGVNEFAARFPSALAALLTVLLCYELARSMFGRTTGLLAGVVLVTTPMLCGAARFANPDALLNFCTVLTLTLFWLGRRERRVWWFAALGAASGLAVLAKGPVGLVVPTGVIFLFFWWERQLNAYADWRWLWSCGTFALVGVPWYVLVSMETHGEFLIGFLGTHNLARAVSPMENHRGFPGYYLAVLLVGTTPWSIFLLGAWWYGFWSTIRQPWQRCGGWWSETAEVPARTSLDTLDPTRSSPDARDPAAAYRLLACWIFTYCLVFGIAATKLPFYILPVIVPCVILIARFLQRWQTGQARVPNWMAFTSAVSLFLIGIFLLLVVAVASGMLPSPMMRERYIPELRPWIWLGLVPATAAVVGWWFLRQGRYQAYVLSVTAAALCLFGPLSPYGMTFFNRHKAPRALVEQAHALRRAEDIRIGCWQLEHLPSLNFYVQRNVDHLAEEKDLPNFLRSPLPVYLFLALPDWEQLQPALHGLGRVVARQPDFYQHREIVVVTNR